MSHRSTDHSFAGLSRGFFDRLGTGLLGASLLSLLRDESSAAERNDPHRTVHGDAQPRSTHFAPQADAVIHLFMNGGPSQMDMFDPKPQLTKHHGKSHFEKIAGEVEFPEAAGALIIA